MNILLRMMGLTIIASVGVWLVSVALPAPALSYRIFYFGAADCEPCQTWKDEELPSWRVSAVGADTPVEVNEPTGRTRCMSPVSPTIQHYGLWLWRAGPERRPLCS